MYSKFAPFLALLMVFFVASCGEEPTIEEYLANAQMLRESGDRNGALIELKNAAKAAPFNMQVRRDMAYLYVEGGLGAEAEKEARRAREMGLPDSEAALLLARAMMQQGKFEELLEEADEFAAEAAPEVQGEIMAWRGLALMELGDFELAGRSVEVALELDPDSALALSANASYQARTGRVDAAREWVERALEANPDSPDALALEGDLLAAEGKLEEARKSYTKSILNRGYPTLVNARRAMIALQLGDYAAADIDLAALRRAGMGKLAYVHEVRGLSLYLQGEYAEATIELEKSLEASPQGIPAKVYLVAALLEQQRSEQAEVVLSQLYRQVPDSPTVARMRATLDMQRADVNAAQRTLQDILERSGDDNVTMVGMLGALSMIEGDPEAAIGHFERVLELEPGDERAQTAIVEARTMRGDFIERDLGLSQGTVDEEQYHGLLLSAAAALQKGQLEPALAIADNLQRQFPQRADALKITAAGQIMSGDIAAGRATMEAILEIEPGDPSTTRNLAKLYGAMGEDVRARDLLSAYLKARPDDGLARAILSGLVVRTEDQPAATAALQEMLSEDPGNHAVRARLVKLRFDAGEYDQVIALTENLKGDWVVAQPALMEMRGKAFANLGQADMAIGSWEQWAEAVPNSVLANYYHAEALASQGEINAALAALDQAVTLNSRYLPARISQVRLTAASGDLAAARRLMDKLHADTGDEQPAVWRTEGWLAVREQRFDAAEDAFRRALASEPQSGTALMLAITLSTLDRDDEAVAELERWIVEFPNDLRLYAMLGDYYVARDPAKARELYEEMLATAPDSVLALNNLAWLQRERDPETALAYAGRAHGLLPEDDVVLDTYGTLLADSGKLVAGGKMLASAVEARPENLRYRLNYGRVLVRQGRASDAREQLRRVIEGADDAAMVAEARDLLASLAAD